LPKPIRIPLQRKARELSAFAKAFYQTLFLGHPPSPAEKELASLPEGRSRIWAKNLHLYYDDGVVLKIRDMVADMRVHDSGYPLMPDRKDSYSIVIHQGVIRLPAASLEALLNRHVLHKSDLPLYDARVSFSGDRLFLHAKLRWRLNLPIPIVLECQLLPIEDGRIVLHVERLRAAEIGLGGLLGLLNMNLETLMPSSGEGAAGMTVRDNRIYIDSIAILPEPRSEGRPTEVRLERGELVLMYDPDHELDPPPPLIDPQAPCYVLGVGHDLLIGKMLMKDAYYQVVSRDGTTHLDFALEGYRQQLAAGNSTLSNDGAVLVRLPNLVPRIGTGPL
jgi:hypothetical protein